MNIIRSPSRCLHVSATCRQFIPENPREIVPVRPQQPEVPDKSKKSAVSRLVDKVIGFKPSGLPFYRHTDYAEEIDHGAVEKRPMTNEITNNPSELMFEQPVTHTGQAWDVSDYRNVRFTYATRHVNPNFAIDLIAEVPPKPCEERIACCDGGGSLGPLGHPKVYINLDKPGNHACGYCGLRFYNVHVYEQFKSDEHHIEV